MSDDLTALHSIIKRRLDAGEIHVDFGDYFGERPYKIYDDEVLMLPPNMGVSNLALTKKPRPGWWED